MGIAGTAYIGYAFGRKTSVIDAWSGTFESAEAGVAIPELRISVGGQIFHSRDDSIIGGAIQASVGVNLVGIIGSIPVGASTGLWTASDASTRAYQASFVDLPSFGLPRPPIQSAQGHVYVGKTDRNATNGGREIVHLGRVLGREAQ